jgi:hypothetical protein
MIAPPCFRSAEGALAVVRWTPQRLARACWFIRISLEAGDVQQMSNFPRLSRPIPRPQPLGGAMLGRWFIGAEVAPADGPPRFPCHRAAA